MPGLIPNPWLILALVLALMTAAGGGYWRGYRAADRSAQIERLETEARASRKAAAEMTRQANAAHAIAGESAIREREAATLATTLQEQLDAYASALAQTPDAACRLGADDVLRLDGLRHDRPAARPVTPLPPERTPDVR